MRKITHQFLIGIFSYFYTRFVDPDDFYNFTVFLDFFVAQPLLWSMSTPDHSAKRFQENHRKKTLRKNVTSFFSGRIGSQWLMCDHELKHVSTLTTLTPPKKKNRRNGCAFVFLFFLAFFLDRYYGDL